MLSRFFGKRDQPDESPSKEAQPTRGLEVIEDDPDTAWGMWNNALAEQEPEVEVPPMKVAPTPQSAEELLDFVVPTVSAPLAPSESITLEQRRDAALDVVELHHKRIGNTIRTLWGYKECSVYINKLIMAGGDGMGHARVGFNQEAVQAMLALSDLHDAEFGPPDNPGGGLGLSI